MTDISVLRYKSRHPLDTEGTLVHPIDFRYTSPEPTRDTTFLDKNGFHTPHHPSLGQSAGTAGVKNPEYIEILNSIMNKQFAQMSLSDFMDKFVPGSDMTKQQFKRIGSLHEIPKLESNRECEMYPILVCISRLLVFKSSRTLMQHYTGSQVQSRLQGRKVDRRLQGRG